MSQTPDSRPGGSESSGAATLVALPEWIRKTLEEAADRSRPSCRFQTPARPGEAVFDPYNQRLKLYLDGPEQLSPDLVDELLDLGNETVSKITIYAKSGDDGAWEALGFHHEGVIRGFFEDADARIEARYPDAERSSSEREETHVETVKIACGKEPRRPELPDGLRCVIAGPEDAGRLTALLERIFEDYPDPLTPERIEQCIRNRSHHFRLVLDSHDTLIAAASAEIDHARRSAEMTDCATLPEHRGRGLMAFILSALEQDMVEIFRIHDLYTLARADEVGMNCVFARLGYEFTGRLINNCRMPNGWESMNIWCRKARRES